MKIVEVVNKYNEKSWLCVVYADTKAAATGDIEGLAEGITLASGSMIYTADGNLGVYNSSSEWEWK